jgi:outer membrane receptor protein involved in Fe transport
LETEARISPSISFSAGYQFADATVLRFPANTALEGLDIPETPRHQFTFQARYANPSRFTLAVQARAIGAQFDDDQNLLKLDPYFTLDLFVSRDVGRHVEVFAAVENLFNERYDVARTPVLMIGPPLLARAGFRLRFGAK